MKVSKSSEKTFHQFFSDSLRSLSPGQEVRHTRPFQQIHHNHQVFVGLKELSDSYDVRMVEVLKNEELVKLVKVFLEKLP
jgi:hypothetical protein